MDRDLAKELLFQEMEQYIFTCIKEAEIEFDARIQTNALNALSEIKAVIHDDTLDDFMKVDAIVNVFIAHNIDIGGCHDF